MSQSDLERVLTNHGQFLRTLAARVTGDEQHGDDILQEAWIRARIAPEGSADHPGWWPVVLRRLGSNLRRARSARSLREREVARSERVPSVAEEAERAELLSTVANAVQDLPEPYRTVVLLRYWEGLPPREIARRRALPLATVKSQIQRGLERLRAVLDENPNHHPSILAALANTSTSSPPILLMSTQAKWIAAAIAIGTFGMWSLLSPTSPDGLAPLGSLVVQQNAPWTHERNTGSSSDKTSPDHRVEPRGEANAKRITMQAPTGPDNTMLSGRILDDRGQARDDASIVVGHKEDTDQWRGSSTDDGSFEITDLPRGVHPLSVSAPGCLPLNSKVTITGRGDRVLKDIVLRRGRQTRGHVLDADGAGIADVEVLLFEQPRAVDAPQLRQLTRTASDGSFTYEGLPTHEFSLGFLAPHRSPIRTLVSEPNASLRITLAEGWPCQVQIHGASDSTLPLRIRALPATGSTLADNEMDWVLHTRRAWLLDHSSSVTCNGLVSGQPYYLQLEEQRETSDWVPCSEVERIDPGQPNVEIHYSSKANLLVSIKGSITSGALRNLLIETRYQRGAWTRAYASSNATQQNEASPGPIPIEVEPRRSVELRLRAQGFGPVIAGPWTCDSGKELRVSVPIPVAQGYELSILAADTGYALADAQIYLGSQGSRRFHLGQALGRSSSTGRAIIALAAGTDMGLIIVREGYLDRRISTNDLSATTVNPLYLNPSASALIQVIDGNGVPVPDVQVMTSMANDQDPSSPQESIATTDIEGVALFRSLEATEYDFQVLAPSSMIRRVMLGGSLATVALQPEDEPNLTRLKLASGMATHAKLTVPTRRLLFGQVLVAGAPLPQAQIYWLAEELGLDQVIAAVDLSTPLGASDEQGRFTLQAIPAGRGTLIIRHRNRTFPSAFPMVIEAGQAEQEFHLATGRLRGDVKSANGAVLAEAKVQVSILDSEGGSVLLPRVLMTDRDGVFSQSGGELPTFDQGTDAHGRYEYQGVPNGYKIKVRASAPGFLPATRSISFEGSERILSLIHI